ncbi:MAG: AraC family transcriptional regulator [Chitinophagaceae bacterium]
MKLFIKNMISQRSKLIVMSIMQQLGLHPVTVETGEVLIKEKLSFKKFDQLKDKLLNNDFELIIDKQTILIEKIKSLVIEMIHYRDELPLINYSAYLSERLQVNYTYLSRYFSRVTHKTIEHFIIAHKIERVKQLLVNNDFTLSEIAWKMHYSSPAHLSAQFKKVTGFTPSVFKRAESKHFIPVTEL